MATVQDNKRKYARGIFCTEANAETRNGSFKCFTINLTPDGMMIRSDEAFSLDQEIAVSFSLPGSDKPVSADGKVVRLVGECIGIRFNAPVSAIMSP